MWCPCPSPVYNKIPIKHSHRLADLFLGTKTEKQMYQHKETETPLKRCQKSSPQAPLLKSWARELPTGTSIQELQQMCEMNPRQSTDAASALLFLKALGRAQKASNETHCLTKWGHVSALSQKGPPKHPKMFGVPGV